MFKVNFSFGFILRNTETGALQYHHPSANNHLVLEQPFLISSPDDLERLYQQIAEIDFLEWVRQQRPNSKWVVDLVTNVTWFVSKIRDHPIGRGKHLPGYVVDNRGIEPLENNVKTGKPYEDNLCFFRCLVLRNGCHTKNLERVLGSCCVRKFLYAKKDSSLLVSKEKGTQPFACAAAPTLSITFTISSFFSCFSRVLP